MNPRSLPSGLVPLPLRASSVARWIPVFFLILAVISPGEPFHFKESDPGWLMNWYMVQEQGRTLFGPDPTTLIDPISKQEFIQTVNLKTKDYEVNPEILYKAMILRARVVEIPAHLDWTEQNKYKGKRKSSIKMLRGFFSGIMSSFIFRPYIFFLAVGTVLMLLSLYELIWLLFDTLSYISASTGLIPTFSESLARQFRKNPQSFIVGGITFLAAIQFLSLGFLSLQSKRYFEELFHLGTSFKKEKQSRGDQ